MGSALVADNGDALHSQALLPATKLRVCMPIDLSVINKIETIDDVKTWLAAHDGQVQTWWDAQHEQNNILIKQMAEITVKLDTLRTRNIWLSGLGAGIGFLIGAFGKSILG